jgi:ectoine hydroxylase-related dioxygenase (phytanoyl-CoA dioxygenase family)
MQRSVTLDLDSVGWKSRGFLVLRDAVGTDVLGELRCAADHVFAQKWAVDMGKRRGFVLVHHPQQHHPEFARTALDDIAIAVAHQLLGRGEIVHKALWNKPPGSCGPIPWHQDDAYRADADQFDSLAAWMALDPVDVESGCLEFSPGDYRQPIAPHRTAATAEVLLEAQADAIALPKVEPCPVDAGDAIIFSSRAFHRSGPNSSNRPRRVLALLVRVPRAIADSENHD